jgi:hypothetical protein
LAGSDQPDFEARKDPCLFSLVCRTPRFTGNSEPTNVEQSNGECRSAEAIKMNPIPKREDIANQLRDLIAGRKTRKEVSAWATQYVTGDYPRVTDMEAWEALKALVGADVYADMENYLFGEADFQKWLEELS